MCKWRASSHECSIDFFRADYVIIVSERFIYRQRGVIKKITIIRENEKTRKHLL